MEGLGKCPDCGAHWEDERTCQDHYHQMLFWEAGFPHLGEVHHLMVLCYHLQHPSKYSQEGLKFALELLPDFVEGEKSPAEVRKQVRLEVDSGRRNWKVGASEADAGEYANKVHWSRFAQDVTEGGPTGYVHQVGIWARSILQDLRKSGNLRF